MIRREFPDLEWLKKQIEQRFETKQGWPNVILHTKSRQTYRPDIEGTLSLFMNIKGQSRCAVDKQMVNIESDYFFISNQHQNYTLEIDNAATETFNIHFSEKLLTEVYKGLLHPADKLLDDPFAGSDSQPEFYNRLYPKDAEFTSIISKLYRYSENGEQQNMLLEEQLVEVLVYLLKVHKNLYKEISQLTLVKSSTRVEVYKRLVHSLNYMHSYYTTELSLDELCDIACLSKFHYLRLFKSVFHQTPYQYLIHLRLEKAKALLQHTLVPVTEISVTMGFQNITSFSRLFQQRYQYSPSNYRATFASRKLAILVN
jgi:AraC family transcriptional regulator